MTWCGMPARHCSTSCTSVPCCPDWACEPVTASMLTLVVGPASSSSSDLVCDVSLALLDELHEQAVLSGLVSLCTLAIVCSLRMPSCQRNVWSPVTCMLPCSEG